MSPEVTRWFGALSALGALVLATSLTAEPPAADPALKARAVAPTVKDIDKTATLDGLLAKSKPTDWSTAKGAVLEGYVIQVIRSDDGDVRLYLAAKPEESDTRKWVIVEVPPAWMAKSPALAEAKLWDLQGKKIHATGWLMYDVPRVKYPRGTSWELHPVTEIVPAK
jgi:hypothetical protein